MLPYKEALWLINLNLSAVNPMEAPWEIRKQYVPREEGDAKSIASSYFLASVFSAKSKCTNIDRIIEE